jgi:hypothetical protein
MKHFLQLSAFTFAIIFYTSSINAQFYQTKEDDNIKGPVRMYKKTVLKDYTEKFGNYEPASNIITRWYIYDEQGRKIFNQRPASNKEYYVRKHYVFDYKNQLSATAETVVKKSDNTINYDLYDIHFFKYEQKGAIVKEWRYGRDKEEFIEAVEKFNAKNQKEEFYNGDLLGTKYGYKIIWKYNDKGQKITKSEYDGFGKLSGKTVWKRDNKGNILETVIYNADGSLKEKTVSEYNVASKQTSSRNYRADGTLNWANEYEYVNDTLETKFIMFTGNKKNAEVHKEYNAQNRLAKINHIIMEGEPSDICVVYEYDNLGNLIKEQSFKNNKPLGKMVYKDYKGKQYLTQILEYYNNEGSITNSYTYKYDQYGNRISFEKYNYTTKFGEQVKIPVEIEEVEILYYDGSSHLKVEQEVAYEKHGKKSPKENWLKIQINNAGKNSPTIYFIDKPGTSGTSVFPKTGSSFSFQASFIRRFYFPYFIVSTENEALMLKVKN